MTPATTTKPQPAADQAPEPAYLIFDTESVPDGRLLAAVKYAGENLTPEEAVRRCQDELRKQSPSGSDFVPVPLQYPVAICVVRVGADFTMQSITRLDEPHFKPRQIVEQFWGGLCKIKEKYRDRVKLVTFNGRGFDLPLLEMAAFRYGCALPRDYFATTRKRFESAHFDVMEFMGNYGAVRGGVSQNMLAKLLGKPGKMQVDGHSVYQMYLDEKIAAINDYCLFDTLDLYFIFLRTRVMMGVMTLADEHQLVMRAKEFLQGRVEQWPALGQLLANWGDWSPWP